jgi:RimJ/RimL family protein N-acetyltransferase
VAGRRKTRRAAFADRPDVWKLHPDRNRWQPERFAVFFDGAIGGGGAVVAELRDTGELIACSRWYEVDVENRTCAIGYTVIARPHWGDGTNAELKQHMLDHSFTWAETVFFHVAAMNLRSCRAVEKLGATCIFEAPRVMAGIEVPYRHYRLERDVWRARD